MIGNQDRCFCTSGINEANNLPVFLCEADKGASKVQECLEMGIPSREQSFPAMYSQIGQPVYHSAKHYRYLIQIGLFTDRDATRRHSTILLYTSGIIFIFFIFFIFFFYIFIFFLTTVNGIMGMPKHALGLKAHSAAPIKSE